jgi:solute carrier family 25 phosphate transporter 3
VKCNKQNNPIRFNKGMFGNMKILTDIKGPAGLLRGWSPTLVGYSFQGLGKFGLNDFFKFKYAELLGQDFKHDNPRIYYALCSGSAEFFADMLLCPWETVKLKVQTVQINEWLEGGTGYAKGLSDGLPKVLAEEVRPHVRYNTPKE